MQPLSDKRLALGRHWDGQPWARAKDVLESNYVMGRRPILRRPHVFNFSGIVSMLKTLVSVRPYSLKVVFITLTVPHSGVKITRDPSSNLRNLKIY